jgi:hypothetical protein
MKVSTNNIGFFMDIVEGISMAVGVIGSAIAIYQAAIIRESKKRRTEIQFLLAGVGNLALSKQQAWENQFAFLQTPQTEEGVNLLRVHTRARDDFIEVANLVSALEGAIDSDVSAITKILNNTLSQSKINNDIQVEAMNNPSRQTNNKEKT